MYAPILIMQIAWRPRRRTDSRQCRGRQPARPRPVRPVMLDHVAWHMTGHQLRRSLIRPDLLRAIQQLGASIRTTRGHVIAPDLVRDIRPRRLYLAILLLILGGFLVIDVTDPGESFQAPRPDELAPAVEHSRILRPQAPRLSVNLIT